MDKNYYLGERSPRRTLQEMSHLMYETHPLSVSLFGDHGKYGMIDFEMTDYIYFLDNVGSLEDLIKGLSELSPFADDALATAECMTFSDFVDFKLALPNERKIASVMGGVSTMPPRLTPLLLPSSFMMPLMHSENVGVSLGLYILRSMIVNCTS